MNEEGFMVLTEKFHLKRGYCCKTSCMHCPYGYDKKIRMTAEEKKSLKKKLKIEKEKIENK